MTTLRRPGVTALLLVLASGCKGCESEATLPALLDAEDATPVGVWVAEGLGASPLTVPVYAVNELGAPVPASEVALTSDATVPASATPGADGWAEAEVTASAAGRYTVSASVDGVAGDFPVWVLAAEPGKIDAPAAALPGAPTAIARAGSGVAAAVGGEVWWTGLDGRQPARVLALPDPIVGLASVEIDSDGVTDLLVTSASRLVLLRGRDAGGLAWGGGWSAASGYAMVDASVGDFDGDNAADLAVVVEKEDNGSLLVLGGDGAWAFQPTDVLEPGYGILAVSLDDLDDNGVGEVTFLTTEGLLRRYTKLDGAWASTLAGTQYELDLGPGSHLLPSTDVTGDGIPELLAVGPTIAGDAWHAWVVTAGAAEPTRYELVDDENGYAWIGLGVGDLDGDGASDLAYAAPDKIARVIWSDASGNFEVQAWADAPSHLAFAVADADGDGVADLVAGADDGLRVFRGERVADNPETPDEDETVPWRPATSDSDLFGLDLLLMPVVGDVTGDLVADVVGVVMATDTGGVALEGVLGVAATDTSLETLRSGGTVTITGSGAALDIAVCGTRAYVLYEEADDVGNVGTWLARADLGAGMGPTLDGEPVAVTGTMLACGSFSQGEVAVGDAAGAVSYVDAAGAVTAGESLGAVGDMVAVPADTGFDELVACAEAGCRVAAGDLDGDGTIDVATQTSAGIEVSVNGVGVVVEAVGTIGVADTDGDGVPELVVGENGLARVFHGLAGGLSPAVASWTWRPVHDEVQFGDLDGDGLPDAFLLGEDRWPDTSPDGDSWLGTLVYAHAQ